MTVVSFSTQSSTIAATGQVETRVIMRLNPPSTSPLIVALGRAGTAGGADWNAPAAVSVPAGKTSFPVSVSVKPSFTSPETAILQLRGGSGYTIGANAEHTIRRTVVGSGAFPDASTTGSHGTLTQVPGGTITQANKVLKDVLLGGTLIIRAPGVKILNFKLPTGASYGIECNDPSAAGLVLEDGEISGIASAGVYGSGVTARRLYIHDSGGDAMKLHGTSLVEDCFITRLGRTAGAHADGNQSRMGTDITFRHNNIEVPINVPGGESNSALLFSTELAAIRKILVELNRLNGGNYCVWFESKDHGQPTECSLLNNRFGYDNRYGPLLDQGKSSIIRGNVWDVDGVDCDGIHHKAGELMEINNS